MTHNNRGRLTVALGGAWRLYSNTIPAGSRALGTVTRDIGDTGALVQIEATGLYVQVNAGVVRTLPQSKVAAALLTDGVDFNDGETGELEALEAQAAELAAAGTKCCIRWSRDSDGQVAYWGAAGATLKPQWYSPTNGGARPGAGRKTADGATGVKRRQVLLDDKTVETLRAIGNGELSAGIREAARRIKQQ